MSDSERMREAVELVDFAAYCDSVADESVGLNRETWASRAAWVRGLAERFEELASAPPSQLPEDAILWKRVRQLEEALTDEGHGERGGFHRGDHTQAENCLQCQALAAVDSRPSLDLTDEEVEALLDHIDVACDLGCTVYSAMDKLRRRQGTGQ